jgi:hypothetical protein
LGGRGKRRKQKARDDKSQSVKLFHDRCCIKLIECG